MIALSEEGRARFDSFPAMVADDLFLDSRFRDEEKAEVAAVEVVVETPFTTRALVRRLVRVRRGNAEMRDALGDHVRPSDRWAWLRAVVRHRPRLIAASLPYVVITVVAGLLARRGARPEWGRDGTTRQGRRPTLDRESA